MVRICQAMVPIIFLTSHEEEECLLTVSKEEIPIDTHHARNTT